MFIRFAIAERHESSDQRKGIFSAIYELERSGELADFELRWFAETERWFDENLRKPSRLAWSSRPNAPERAITWLKLSAHDHIARMRELVAILAHKDILVEELKTDRPGYIVYEDEHQVAAIPFERDTFRE